MAKNFSKSEIQTVVKEAWDLKRQLQIKLSAAQDMVAKMHGYTKWSLLKRDFNRQHPDVPLLEALRQYVKSLSDFDTEQLFLNGTIWVSLDDVESGKVTVKSFDRFGSNYDGITRQYTNGLGLIVDMDGMPDAYKLETEEEIDEDGGWQILTIKEARSMILDGLERDVDGNFDSIILQIEQRQLEEEI